MRFLGVFIILLILGSVPFFARRKPQGIVKIGAQFIPVDQIEAVYAHDLQATYCLQRILEDDRSIPILSDEIRVKAERLVKAFYDDKGD